MIVLVLKPFMPTLQRRSLVDGKLVAAAEEERFRRIKHWAGFPSQAITYCFVRRVLRYPMSSTSQSIRTTGQSVPEDCICCDPSSDPNLIIQRWMNRGCAPEFALFVGDRISKTEVWR